MQRLWTERPSMSHNYTLCGSLRNDPPGKVGFSRWRCPSHAQLLNETSYTMQIITQRHVSPSLFTSVMSSHFSDPLSACLSTCGPSSPLSANVWLATRQRLAHPVILVFLAARSILRFPNVFTNQSHSFFHTCSHSHIKFVSSFWFFFIYN